MQKLMYYFFHSITITLILWLCLSDPEYLNLQYLRASIINGGTIFIFAIVMVTLLFLENIVDELIELWRAVEQKYSHKNPVTVTPNPAHAEEPEGF
jgi:hypothetical protein